MHNRRLILSRGWLVIFLCARKMLPLQSKPRHSLAIATNRQAFFDACFGVGLHSFPKRQDLTPFPRISTFAIALSCRTPLAIGEASFPCSSESERSATLARLSDRSRLLDRGLPCPDFQMKFGARLSEHRLKSNLSRRRLLSNFERAFSNQRGRGKNASGKPVENGKRKNKLTWDTGKAHRMLPRVPR